MADDPVPDLRSCQSSKGRTGVSGSHVLGSIVVEVMVYLRKDMKGSCSLDSEQGAQREEAGAEWRPDYMGGAFWAGGEGRLIVKATGSLQEFQG